MKVEISTSEAQSTSAALTDITSSHTAEATTLEAKFGTAATLEQSTESHITESATATGQVPDATTRTLPRHTIPTRGDSDGLTSVTPRTGTTTLAASTSLPQPRRTTPSFDTPTRTTNIPEVTTLKTSSTSLQPTRTTQSPPPPSNPTVTSTSQSSSSETVGSTMVTTGTQTEQTNVTVQTGTPTGLGNSTVQLTTAAANATAGPVAASTAAGEDRDEVPAPGRQKSGSSKHTIIATSICVAVLVLALVVLGLWFYNVKWKLHKRDGPLLREPDKESVTGKSYSTVQYYNDGVESIKLRDV